MTNWSIATSTESCCEVRTGPNCTSTRNCPRASHFSKWATDGYSFGIWAAAGSSQFASLGIASNIINCRREANDPAIAVVLRGCSARGVGADPGISVRWHERNAGGRVGECRLGGAGRYADDAVPRTQRWRRSRGLAIVVDRRFWIYDFPDPVAALYDRAWLVCGVSRRIQPHLPGHLQRVSAGEYDQHHDTGKRDALRGAGRWGQ